MARGNTIVVEANPRGKFMEGFIGAGITPKPGQILQIDATIAIKGGRFTYKLADMAADGSRPIGPISVLTELNRPGLTVTDAFAAGDRCTVYVPLAGDELNVLYKDETGTTDDHPAGEVGIIDDTTGKIVLTAAAATEFTSPFLLMETITDPTADTLAWVVYSGY